MFELTLLNFLLLLYLIFWFIGFYNFAMQRCVLLISRSLNVDFQLIGFVLLTKSYKYKVWFVRFVKILLLVLVIYYGSFILSICTLLLGYFISIIMPIPYKFLFFKKFQKRLEPFLNTFQDTDTDLYKLASKIQVFLIVNNMKYK